MVIVCDATKTSRVLSKKCAKQRAMGLIALSVQGRVKSYTLVRRCVRLGDSGGRIRDLRLVL